LPIPAKLVPVAPARVTSREPEHETKDGTDPAPSSALFISNKPPAIRLTHIKINL